VIADRLLFRTSIWSWSTHNRQTTEKKKNTKFCDDCKQTVGQNGGKGRWTKARKTCSTHGHAPWYFLWGASSAFSPETIEIYFMSTQIAAQLEPLDILRLSRISKQFRATFASKHSRHIWIAARRNISMPECPSDLTELQYISLMFEQSCQVCCIPYLGYRQTLTQTAQACGSRAFKVDYSLRVRFCGSCFEAK